MGLFTAVYPRSHSFASFKQISTVVVILTFMFAAPRFASALTTSLSRVSCGTNAYSGPGTDACSVYLASKTRARIYVALSSNNAAVTVPSGVTVKSGAMTTGFAATIASVTSTQTATISAQAGGLTVFFSITLSPSTTSGTAAASVSATSISFGSVVVNSVASQPITVSSVGTAPLVVNSEVVSGAGFSVSGATYPVTLNPGQSLTTEVQFAPTTATSYSGQLTLATSVSNKAVALSGTGTSYSFNLSWSAPTSSPDPVAGYNVYRALSGSTSFQRLNATIDKLTTFSDPSVQAGESYSYYVKSVDAQGVESPASNTISVTIQ